MIVFITTVATLNLIVGYVIGVYIGWLPALLASNRSVTKDSTIPVAVLAADAKPTRYSTPAAAVRVREPKAVDEAAASEPAVEPTVEPTLATEQRTSARRDIKQGLSTFRQRLAQIRDQIDAAAGDGKRLDECADEMRTENANYVDQSQATIETLGNSREDNALRSAVADQHAGIALATSQLDEIADADSADDKLAILQRSSNQLDESTAALSEKLAAEFNDTAVSAPTANPLGGLKKIDDLQELINRHFGTIDDESQPLPVAWVRIDQDDTAGYPPSERLLDGVAKLLESCLGEGQAAAIAENGHLLVTLPGDAVADAADRLEVLRQKVAATQFAHKGQQYSASVTCAVTDSAAFGDRDSLFAGLEATMNEAERFGTNRTFHHDGHLVAPVIPATVSVERVTLEI